MEPPKVDKALADFDKSLQLNPKDSSTYLNRGNLYASTKDYEKAKLDYQKIVELNTEPNLVKQAQDVLAQIAKQQAGT